MVIRAHFDGKVIVPDEPVNLPTNHMLKIMIEPVPNRFAERKAAWQRLKSRKVHGSSIPLEVLRRENLYEDRI